MPKFCKTALKLAVSAGLVCILYSKLDLADVVARLQGADFRWLALAFALMVANTVVSAAKWRLFLRADGLAQPLGSLWASYITASFFNLFLPSTIGGDAYRIADVGSRTGEHTRVAASILADRITGFLALSAYGSAAAIFARADVPEWKMWFPLPSVAALLLLAGFSMAVSSRKFFGLALCAIPSRRLREKAGALAGTLVDAMRGYAGKPAVVVNAVLISLIFQFNLISAVWAISRSIGLEFPFSTFFLFLPIKTFLEMIPVSVFGLGLRDLGYAVFALAMGLGEGAATAAALISAAEVALTVVYSAIGGVVFVARKAGHDGIQTGEEDA